VPFLGFAGRVIFSPPPFGILTEGINFKPCLLDHIGSGILVARCFSALLPGGYFCPTVRLAFGGGVNYGTYPLGALAEGVNFYLCHFWFLAGRVIFSPPPIGILTAGINF
jgi:hypothetical protein